MWVIHQTDSDGKKHYLTTSLKWTTTTLNILTFDSYKDAVEVYNEIKEWKNANPLSIEKV